MNYSHLQIFPAQQKCPKIDSCSAWGCTWCALTKFPCKLRLIFFSPPWGVRCTHCTPSCAYNCFVKHQAVHTHIHLCIMMNFRLCTEYICYLWIKTCVLFQLTQHYLFMTTIFRLYWFGCSRHAANSNKITCSARRQWERRHILLVITQNNKKLIRRWDSERELS